MPVQFVLLRAKHLIIICLLFFFGFFLITPLTSKALTVSPPRIELQADPGQSLTYEVKLINEETESKTLYPVFKNYEAKDESGDPEFLTNSENLATWISTSESIILGPKETKTIVLTINIPLTAEPGGYYSAILFQENPVNPQDKNIAISSQLGPLILLTVSGNISDLAGILEFSTKNKQRFYTSLPIEFYFRFQNTGPTWVKPLGDILIYNSIGTLAKNLYANRFQGNVLSKSIRKFESYWITSGKKYPKDNPSLTEDPLLKPTERLPEKFWPAVKYQYKNFALGFYRAKLNLAYGTPAQNAISTFTFFVFPWQLMLVSGISLIILLIILRLLIRRYNRWVISKAQNNNPPPPTTPKRPSRNRKITNPEKTTLN